MSPTLRNILSIIGGIIVGMLVNMLLVMNGSTFIALPEGVDPTDMESITANSHLFEPKHFIFPFLAHALGTLVAAWMAVRTCATNHVQVAMIVGGIMLVAGIVNAFSIPLPTWFMVTDLLLAYLPMAWLGWKLSGKSNTQVS